MRKCILDEERNCMECGRCDYCDLDPEKICDNCCKCIEKDADYSSIMIERIVPKIKKEVSPNFTGARIARPHNFAKKD